MIFARTKQLVFTNNKGGVGKTTSAFNVATMFAKNGYKTVIVDLDPQCNISRLALGESFLNKETPKNDIFTVLEGIMLGNSDVDYGTPFSPVSKNLSILEGSIFLSGFEGLLSNSFSEAAAGLQRGFFVSSAIDRFLKRKGLYEEIDLFIIDTNPSLSQLNKAIFLGSNYFITPMNPDAFNHQGIKNIGNFFEESKKNWNLTAKVLAKEKDIKSSYLLEGESVYIGYIINSYNVYSQKTISSQQKWIELLPETIKQNLSLKQSKNGLVELSWKEKIGQIQDYGQLSTLSQEKSKAIFEITEQEAGRIGTIENLEKSKIEFQEIYEEILERLSKW